MQSTKTIQSIIAFFCIFFTAGTNAQNVSVLTSSDCSIQFNSSDSSRIYEDNVSGTEYISFPFSFNGLSYDSVLVSLFQPTLFLKSRNNINRLTVFPFALPLTTSLNDSSFAFVNWNEDLFQVGYRSASVSPDVSYTVFDSVYQESFSFSFGLDQTSSEIFLQIDSVDWVDHPIFVDSLGPILVGPEPYFGTQQGDTSFLSFGLNVIENSLDISYFLNEEFPKVNFSADTNRTKSRTLRSSLYQNICFRFRSQTSSIENSKDFSNECPNALDSWIDDLRIHTLESFQILDSSGKLIFRGKGQPSLIDKFEQLSWYRKETLYFLIINDKCSYVIYH